MTLYDDIEDCFDPENISECGWRPLAASFPLLLFWLCSPLILTKISTARRRYVNRIRGQLRVLLLMLLCLIAAFGSIAQNVSITQQWTALFVAATYLCQAGIVEVQRRREQLTHASIFISILLTCLFKTSFLVVKSLERKLDLFLIAEVLLTMGETVLLSISDRTPLNETKESPELTSSWLSKLLFNWVSPLISKCSKRTITKEDLFRLRDDCTSKNQMKAWDREWNKAQKKQKERNERNGTNEPTALVRPFAKIHLPLIINITVCRLLADMIHYINPMLLKLLIDFVSSTTGGVSFGIGIACVMFISAEVRSFLQNYQVYGMFRLTVHMQTVLTSTVLKKTLRLSPTARSERTSGEILNMAAVDVEKITASIPYLQNMWSIPFQVVLALIMLAITIGYAALPGILILASFAPINYYASQYIKAAQLKQMKLKDERTKMSNELLNGLKVVKLYAWEETFEERIIALRKAEVQQLKWLNVAMRIVDAANASVTFFVALASFPSFVLIYSSEELTPAVAFVSLAIFNQLRQPMRMLGMLVNNVIQARVSNKRLKSFLAAEEIQPDTVGSDTGSNDILLRDASLNWAGPEDPSTLKNINLAVAPKELIAVVGPVGSGKSSLISAMIGEMYLKTGSVDVSGSIGYVPQQPWIFNKSIRENILFGNAFDRASYDKIIYACALHRDFAMFTDGDHTEVGENGVNLSGGQKARIGLARALYQNCSVYLLDDPLSAVDAHVGRAVFDRVLGPNGLLAEKTRLLVTHGLQYTKTADQIIVMNEGSIVQTGDYETLRSVDGMFSHLLQECSQDNISTSEEDEKPALERTFSSDAYVTKTGESDSEKRGLVQKEKMKEGKVSNSVYWLYMKSMNLINAFGFLGFFVLHYLCITARALWLSDWSNQNTPAFENENRTDVEVETRLAVYAALGCGEILMIVISFVYLTIGTMRACINLHNPLIRALLRAPITFFDVTPIGRIINRLAKDMEIVDNLSFQLRHVTQNILHVGMIFLLVSYSNPAFILLVFPLMGTYWLIMRYFISTIRQLRRMESANRSPIYSTFRESIQGYSTIRSFNKVPDITRQMDDYMDNFIQCRYLSIAVNRWLATRLELLGNIVVPDITRQMDDYMDNFIQCRYLSIAVNRWLATRLELLGNIVVLSAAVLGTISSRYFGLSPGLVGLSVSYALSITEVLNIAVRMMGELETNIISVERIKEYHKLETEAEWDKDPKPSADWPSKGAITISNYQMKYREELPLVLKGVDAQIEPGQKIAVIGRTGSGKSSLTMGLFRMIEATDGYMEIDGIRTDSIGLHQLRSVMAIIPQDPVLFSGTLRFNLDPFDKYSDADIWSALQKCQLNTFASANPEGLQFVIAEGGKNMSVGERQLVCLGRAILRGGKILILDEATASVDTATDALVQQVVRRYFPDSTIITIAHRLDTIADYDRIMVLADGEVIEYGAPAELLANKGSHYAQMVEKSRRM